jgi:hypothetical protein
MVSKDPKKLSGDREIAARKGGPRHPLCPLPLLPSGPGGVHSRRVTRDHKNVTHVARTHSKNHRRLRPARFGRLRSYVRCSLVAWVHHAPRCASGVRPDPPRTAWSRSTLVLAKRSRGGRGIRTLGTFQYTRFPIVHLRPLGHPSRRFSVPCSGSLFRFPIPYSVREWDGTASTGGSQ